MSKIITTDDINSSKFYQLPKAFFHNPLYKSMKNESKIAYSILRDLLELSIKNKWINEKNQVYVKLSRNKLMQYLNVKGTQKITQIMDELKEKELIVERQIGISKCNEIYMCIPDELDVLYSDNSLLDNRDNIKNFENQKSRDLKNKGQELLKSKVKNFENQILTKTYPNNTDLNNTNTIFSSDEAEVIEFYKNSKGKVVSPAEKKKLKTFMETYTAELVLKAIDEAVMRADKVNLKYIESCLIDWVDLEGYEKHKVAKNTLKAKNKGTQNKESTFNAFKPREEYNDPNYVSDLKKKLLGWDKYENIKEEE